MTTKSKENKPVKSYIVYVVSGGFGASGEQIAETVLAQFPNIDVEIRKFNHVKQIKDVERVVKKAVKANGIIIHTMVNHKLRDVLVRFAEKEKLIEIDLMGPLINGLSDMLGQKPQGKPGLYRIRRKDYFKRIDAINFTVSHDDGLRTDDLHLAEIVLTGVSRSGKTPLGMYLAIHGWKVANVPLVLGIKPPDELFQIDNCRVVGLSIDCNHLMSHRKERYGKIGAVGISEYVKPSSVHDELEYAKKIYKKGRFHVINVTNKPIESIANNVIDVVTNKQY